MSQLEDAVARHRRLLIERETETVRRIVASWSLVYGGIGRRLIDLLLSFGDADVITVAMILRENRLAALLAQIQTDLANWAGLTASHVAVGQSDAVAMAAAAAQEYFAWNRLPIEALHQFVATTADGSPLRDVFDRYGVQGSRIIEDGLTESVAIGENPRAAARAISKAMKNLPEGESPIGRSFESLRQLRNHSTLVARTEIIRSHRSAALENYKANEDVVLKWEWSAALDTRTCPVCWAMDGKQFPIDEPFASHPQCRCSPIPVTEWSEDRVSGPERFASLSRSDQMEILGESKLELYESGEISLDDLVLETYSSKWGAGRREKSLKSLSG